MTAIINTGWCHRKGSNEWIRNGDLLSVKRHIVALKNTQDDYYQDIALYCYGEILFYVFMRKILRYQLVFDEFTNKTKFVKPAKLPMGTYLPIMIFTLFAYFSGCERERPYGKIIFIHSLFFIH